MPLSLRLDHDFHLVSEPGFSQFFPSQATAETSAPADSASRKQLWHDQATGTILLKPLQFQADWLNSSAQLSSILRLTNDFNANATDLANGAIFEAASGNPSNPYIHHSPVSPTITAPNITPVGITTPIVIVPLIDQSETAIGAVWQANPGEGRRFPTATNNLIPLVESKQRLPANQAFYLRWFHPDPRYGHQCVYAFCFGQYGIVCRTSVMEIFLDVSAHGDRSDWQKVYEAPIFTATDDGGRQAGLQPFGLTTPVESPAQDRSLFILPYRRQRVLFIAHTGKYVSGIVRTVPQRLLDASDWDITRSDTLVVWALTPSPGRFQVQTATYEPGPAICQLPPFQIEYIPTVAPTIALNADYADHGTVLTPTLTAPPGYTLPKSPTSDDCPPPTADGSAQGRTYGLTLTFQSSSDQKWTPQYYGAYARTTRSFVTNPATVTILNDKSGTPGSPLSRIVSAHVSVGEKPGDGRMEAQLLDVGTFPLASYYYRSHIPVQLQLTGTACFSGLSEPIEVRPLRYLKERDITVRAADRWKLLQDTYLRDQEDWTGVGHITVVDSVAQQAGIDTSSAEYPANFLGSLAAEYNAPLGGPNVTTDQLAGNVIGGWKPQINETAASYILRIAETFSGWVVGFRLDGTFYYLPRYYFTTSALTFYSSTAANPSGPLYRNPVEFRTIEPEGNIVQVRGQIAIDGSAESSGLFIDWASVKNPAVANYLGFYKWNVYTVGGAFTCPQLNWMAYTIFQQARRRHVTVSFQADFVPTLKIGQVFTLQNYGNYRLTGMQADLHKDNWDQANYTAELVENGYG